MIIKDTTGEPTKLRYDLATDPFPLQASNINLDPGAARLTIVATNPNQNPDTNTVAIAQITIQIPLGDAGNQLCPALHEIALPVTPPGWSAQRTALTGYVQFILTPQPSPAEIGGTSLEFVFNAVPINSQAGTVEIDVGESTSAVAQLYTTKFPNSWGDVDFWVEPANIAYGGSTTLNWQGPEGATYTIQYYTPSTGIVTIPKPSQPALANRGQYPGLNQPNLALVTSTVFTLNVIKSVGQQSYQSQIQKTVTVPIPWPQITSFTGSLDTTTVPRTIDLSWATQNTEYCILSADPSNEKAPKGSFLAAPAARYILIAVGEDDETAGWSRALSWSSAGQSSSQFGGIGALAFSPDGAWLYALYDVGQAMSGNTQLAVFQPTSDDADPLKYTGRSFSFSAPAGGYVTVYSLAVSPDGAHIYVALRLDGQDDDFVAWYISIFDAASLNQLNTLQLDQLQLSSMAVWAGGGASYLYATSGNSLLAYTVSGNYLTAFGSLNIPNLLTVAISPDGTQVYTLVGGATPRINVYLPTNNATTPLELVTSYAFTDLPAQQGLVVTPGQRYPAVLIGGNAQEITVLDGTSMTIGATMNINSPIGGVAVAPDGEHLYVGTPYLNNTITAYVPGGLVGERAVRRRTAW
jgi:hypothetical protein